MTTMKRFFASQCPVIIRMNLVMNLLVNLVLKILLLMTIVQSNMLHAILEVHLNSKNLARSMRKKQIWTSYSYFQPLQTNRVILTFLSVSCGQSATDSNPPGLRNGIGFITSNQMIRSYAGTVQQPHY